MDWRDYVYGMGHLAREAARKSLRAAHAASIAQTTDRQARDEFYRRNRLVADW